VTVALHEGGGGVYDVTRDGEVIFSKHAAGRFPDEDEILAALRG